MLVETSQKYIIIIPENDPPRQAVSDFQLFLLQKFPIKSTNCPTGSFFFSLAIFFLKSPQKHTPLKQPLLFSSQVLYNSPYCYFLSQKYLTSPLYPASQATKYLPLQQQPTSHKNISPPLSVLPPKQPPSNDLPFFFIYFKPPPAYFPCTCPSIIRFFHPLHDSLAAYLKVAHGYPKL